MSISNSVLIVEDDSDIRELFNEIFESCEFKVSMASDGIEALDYLRECEEKKVYPDIILLDMLMPRLNGLELIRIILNQHPDTLGKLPYIITSAKDHSEFQKMDLPENFIVIKKPMDVDLLIEKSKEHAKKFAIKK